MSDTTPGSAARSNASAGASPCESEFELPIDGFQGTPEEIERQWFEKVYRGRGDRMRQLTWRAVLMGMVLGSVLSLTNLYIGLKSGWAFGVAITACILSYACWNVFYRLGLVATPMTILENNCMQSTASSAGYSTGGTLISAFAAYMMLYPEAPLSLPLMLGWVFFLAVLGVTMAIPMKRQMINIEQLRFPSGIAAAETLRALHSHGNKAARPAAALGIAGVLAAISHFWANGLQLISEKLLPWSIGTWMEKLNASVFGKAWTDRTIAVTWEPMFVAAGALVGLRVSFGMLLGGTLCWAVFVPVLQSHEMIPVGTYKDVVKWTLWGGVACMVTSSLLSMAFEWRSMLRAFGSLASIFRRQKAADTDIAAIETPMSWFLLGQAAGFVGLAVLAKLSFGIPVWQSATAVGLTILLSLVACRVTGETDTTPIGAMGKVTQLVFGVLSPGNVCSNLMAANITAGAASSSADLLTDLKSGYLLGANPRKQFLAQFAGIFAGTLVTVLCFRVLVPDAAVLGGERFPAPSAQAWKAVAEVLSTGLGSLGPVRLWSIAIGGLIGLLLPTLGRLFPKCAPWIPSPAGIGLAWTFQWYTSFLFFLGSLLGYVFEKSRPEQAKEFTFPVASGIIAGDSLMGVVLIFCENGPALFRQIFSS